MVVMSIPTNKHLTIQPNVALYLLLLSYIFRSVFGQSSVYCIKPLEIRVKACTCFVRFHNCKSFTFVVTIVDIIIVTVVFCKTIDCEKHYT